MKHTAVSPLLRWALAADAVASLLTGLALSLFTEPLQQWLALPHDLLLHAGIFTVGYALAVAAACRCRELPVAVVWTVIIGNALWAAACIVLAIAPWLTPSAPGLGFLLLQAVIVFGFAELQWLGLRRSPATGPSALGAA